MTAGAPESMSPSTAGKNSNSTGKQDSDGVSRKGRVFMAVLALQFGLQPLLQKECIDYQLVDRISLIIVTEVTKIFLCVFVILSSGPGVYRPLLDSWTLRGSLAAAALPAAAYALQNWMSQLAYMNLDSLTFNLLNQTKTLFAALCLYLVMGKKQSPLQLVALLLLLAGALLLNANTGGTGADASSCDGVGGTAGGGSAVCEPADDTREAGGLTSAEAFSARLWLGVLPVMGAALLSGLSAAVTQRTLQRSGRNTSQLSLELAVYGVVTLLVTSGCGFGASSGGGLSWRQGLFRGWTPWTWLPVLSQAAGGLVVGQVTKHAGSVRKGFALIGGILVTATVQSTLERSPLTTTHWMAAVLVAGGTYLHANYPYRPRKEAGKML